MAVTSSAEAAPAPASVAEVAIASAPEESDEDDGEPTDAEWELLVAVSAERDEREASAQAYLAARAVSAGQTALPIVSRRVGNVATAWARTRSGEMASLPVIVDTGADLSMV